MTTPELYEDVESLSYDELISNLIAWLEIDIEERRAELEQAQRNYNFFDKMLDAAHDLSEAKKPTKNGLRFARIYLELLNGRRLLHKTVEGWENMSRDEQIDILEKTDEAVFVKYGL